MREEWEKGSAGGRCYQQPNKGLTIAGGTLIAVGALLILLCIPGWAWAALAGLVLMGAGVLLIRLGRAGR